MRLERVSARIGLPFGLGQIEGEWAPTDRERQAAWEMYVELVTRVSVVELDTQDGLIREALSSLHSLFDTTRSILKAGGPELATPNDDGFLAFGHISLAILNRAVRPLLAKWHPLLEDHESSRPPEASRLEWEQSWARHDELRQALADVRSTLEVYARLLGDVCGARDLILLAAPKEVDSP